jgi:hypothetical protein
MPGFFHKRRVYLFLPTLLAMGGRMVLTGFNFPPIINISGLPQVSRIEPYDALYVEGKYAGSNNPLVRQDGESFTKGCITYPIKSPRSKYRESPRRFLRSWRRLRFVRVKNPPTGSEPNCQNQ